MPDSYTTIQGDMWDGIAMKIYGAESGMNALLNANPAYYTVVVFPAGVVLSVPEYVQPATHNLPPWRR